MDAYSRINRMIQAAQFVSDVASDARIFRAPGRVNIIGEHTDYNDGLVLPTNTALYTWLAIKPRTDRVVSILAKNFEEQRDFNLDAIEPSNKPEWIDYLKGVCTEIEATGITLCGAEIVIHGEIPIGGGMSSSASLELVMATAMLAISDASLPAQEIAKLCQRAEHTFAGVNCGIMDQMISAAGGVDHALLLDCRSLEGELVPLPQATSIVVLDTGTRRGLVDSAYNERREQCEIAATHFGVKALRDVSLTSFAQRQDELDEVTRARARHVISEIERTTQAAKAMRAGDRALLGQLMDDSHVSLRDDFEVSSEALDTIVDCARGTDGCLGARMTGAGFGGCAVALVDSEKAPAFCTKVEALYRSRSGHEPQLYVSAATAGASVE